MKIENKQDLIKFLFENEILLKPEQIMSLKKDELKSLGEEVDKDSFEVTQDSIVDLIQKIKNEKTKINVEILDSETNEEIKPGSENLDLKSNYNIDVIENYRDLTKKRDVQDFVKLLNQRYKNLSEILRARSDLVNLTSINKIESKKDKGDITVIGLIKEMRESKNGHIILELEDPTGTINILFNKNNPELFELTKEMVLDEVIAVTGQLGEGIMFSRKVAFPDVPLNKELKKAPEEVYAVLISDIHIGSKHFMREEFNKFLSWINGETGNEEQKRIASKVKYLLVPGDIIDGVGVFPNQQSTLEIEDIKEQYAECARIFKKVPQDMSIIFCPGNHDPLRLAEPQPVIPEYYAKDLVNMPNVTMLTNPGKVRIHKTDNFPGFDVLFYHGGSYFYYSDKVESLRNAGGPGDIAHTMRFLLQKRHLAPTHTSTQFIPDPTKDPLLIKEVPDFIVSGHVHKASVTNYRNVTLLCGSCWDGISEYALKFGSLPEPGRVVVINLQTREVKIMKFISEEKEEEMRKNARMQ